MGRSSTKTKVFTAAFGIEPKRHCDRLKQGRFARAVFADKKRDFGMKLEAIERANGGETERVFVKRLDFVPLERETDYELAGYHMVADRVN